MLCCLIHAHSRADCKKVLALIQVSCLLVFAAITSIVLCAAYFSVHTFQGVPRHSRDWLSFGFATREANNCCKEFDALLNATQNDSVNHPPVSNFQF